MLLEERQKQDDRCSTMLKEIIALYEKPHILSSEENARMTKIDEEIDSEMGSMTGGMRIPGMF